MKGYDCCAAVPPRMAHAAFLFVAGAWSAIDGIRAEVTSGEPSLRGLVHFGLAGLFAAAMVCSDSCLPIPFSTVGMALAAAAADITSVQGQLLALAAVDTATRQRAYPPATYLASLAGMMTLPTNMQSPADAVPPIAHRAFMSVLAIYPDDGASLALFALAHGVLAAASVRFQESSGCAILLLAAVCRVAITAQSAPICTDRGVAVAPTKDCEMAPRWLYYTVCTAYAMVLFVEAAQFDSGGAVAMLTRFAHVGAVLAALVGFVPRTLDAFPEARWVTVLFPTVDITICAFRWHGGSVSIPTLLFARILTAAAVGALLLLLRVQAAPLSSSGTDHEAPDTTETVEPLLRSHSGQLLDERLSMGAMGLYIAARGTLIAHVTSYEEAVHVTFHMLVVTLALAGIALRDHDACAKRMALSMLSVESIGGLAVAARLRHSFSTLALVSITSTLLAIRVFGTDANRGSHWSLFLLRPVVVS